MSEKRKVILHQSLLRPILIGGAERTLALINGVIAAALIFGIGSWQAVLLGLVFALAVHSVLVYVAGKDPQGFDVYRRHITYQDHYPARAAHTAPPALIKYVTN